MYELGKTQILTVTRVEPIGCYLGDHYESRANDVLLPAKWIPDVSELASRGSTDDAAQVAVGDKIEVFIYKDSEDRPIATTMIPKIRLGETAVLTVIDTTKIGAFLDWGLEKDLLLPFHEQTMRVRKGDDVLVTLYIDKSERLCASMSKVYHALRQDSPYKKNDQVDGFIYEVDEETGAYVAVDGVYSGRIAPQEIRGQLLPGKWIKARVTAVKADGKLDLSMQKRVEDQMTDDAQTVLTIIGRNGGSIPFTDKASPEQIDRMFSMSKNAFKRAVGRLLKEEKIRIADGRIEII